MARGSAVGADCKACDGTGRAYTAAEGADWFPCSKGCLGWHVFNGTEIERCDTGRARFATDEDAAKHVEQSYDELLAACKKQQAALNVCARYLLHTGDQPEPGVMAEAIGAGASALKAAGR